MDGLDFRAELEEAKAVVDVPKGIENLFLDWATADVVFVFKCGTEIPAHSWVLAANSIKLVEMIGNTEKIDGKFIVDMSHEILDWFEVFLESFYKPKMDLRFHSIDLVMELAKKYDADHCMNTCVQYLSKILSVMSEFGVANTKALSKQDFFELFGRLWSMLAIDECFTDALCIIHQVSVFFGCGRLLTKCHELMPIFGCYVIDAMPNSECVTKGVIKAILATDFAHRDENTVFNACVEWASKRYGFLRSENKKDSAALREILGESLDLIQFDKMTTYQPCEFVEKCSGAFTIDEYIMKQINN